MIGMMLIVVSIAGSVSQLRSQGGVVSVSVRSRREFPERRSAVAPTRGTAAEIEGLEI
jgi:hypothetical protein